jgi:hypothetical protein
LGFLGYQEWLGAHEPYRPLSDRTGGQVSQARVPNPVQGGPVSGFTYYLVSSSEQASLVAPLLAQLEPLEQGGGEGLPHHVVRIVASTEEVQATRQSLDAANEQLDRYGEPRFRLVDLRAFLTAVR